MAPESDNILEIKGLTSGYGKLPILHDVNFSVARGSLTSVIGPNGAGKTTLMSSIINTVNIMAGEIWYEGQKINDKEPNEIAAMGVGYVPQSANVFPNMTVDENLEMGAHTLPKQQRMIEIESIYHMFPRLRERIKQKASTLSGGERQMLAIGSALLTNPRMIILDEPTSGLSPQIVDDVMDSIIQIRKKGATLIWVVEENPKQVLSVADMVYVMENGYIKTKSSSQELLEAEDFSQIFLGV
jgi:ABC-type branched-subunit amino acid transport system ATPase component